MRLKEVTKPLLRLCDKETKNLWRAEEASGVGSGWRVGEDATRLVYTALRPEFRLQ